MRVSLKVLFIMGVVLLFSAPAFSQTKSMYTEDCGCIEKKGTYLYKSKEQWKEKEVTIYIFTDGVAVKFSEEKVWSLQKVVDKKLYRKGNVLYDYHVKGNNIMLISDKYAFVWANN
jgi:hypothetical protein